MVKKIHFNTDKRKNAANSFGKYFFKLMNNKVELVNNAKDYVRCIRKPIFVSQKTFSKNFVAIHEIKPALTLNKRI